MFGRFLNTLVISTAQCKYNIKREDQNTAKRKKKIIFFFKLGLTPQKAEQPLLGMELQEKEVQKD